MKKLTTMLFVITLIVLLPINALAHPGKTDKNGGHYDSATGEYHYHHGYPAHQHENGICPYDNNYTNELSYTETQMPNSSNTSDIIISILITLAVYNLPILIYRFLIIKSNVQTTKKAITIASVFGFISFFIMSAIKFSLSGNVATPLPAVVWGFVNYLILRPKKDVSVINKKAEEENNKQNSHPVENNTNQENQKSKPQNNIQLVVNDKSYSLKNPFKNLDKKTFIVSSVFWIVLSIAVCCLIWFPRHPYCIEPDCNNFSTSREIGYCEEHLYKAGYNDGYDEGYYDAKLGLQKNSFKEE